MITTIYIYVYIYIVVYIYIYSSLHTNFFYSYNCAWNDSIIAETNKHSLCAGGKTEIIRKNKINQSKTEFSRIKPNKSEFTLYI